MADDRPRLALARRLRELVVPEDGRPRPAGWLLVSVAAVAVALALATSDPVLRADWALYDRALRLATRTPSPPDDVVIVAIDEASFTELGLAWPWPRRVHAALVDALSRGGARTIVFDIVFDAPAPDPSDDDAFAAALKRAGNVVLGADHVEIVDRSYAMSSWAAPVPLLGDAAASVASVNVAADPDGVVRRFTPLVAGRDTVSMAAARRAPSAPAPLDTEPRLLGFLGPARRGFRTVSYYQAVEAWTLLPRRFFAGKTVFVGRSLQASPDDTADRFRTAADDVMSGVEIHATAFDALLRNRFVAEPFGRQAAFWALLLGMALLGAVVARVAGPLAVVAAAIASVALGPFLSYALLALADVRVPAFSPSLAFAAVAAPVAAWRAALGRGQRRLIRRAFEHYVSPAIVGELLRDPSRLALRGEEYDLSVLFADLENFTTFSEHLQPEEVRQRLGACLEAMVSAVLAQDGTVDKLLGDGLVALFGCPVRTPDHALRACRAALDMQRRMRALAGEWGREGLRAPGLRIGINSGRAVAGNFGTATLFQFTAVGDVVNTASRLEGANKQYGTRILVGETTAKAVRDQLAVRFVDRATLKGKAEPVEVFEVTAGRDGPD